MNKAVVVVGMHRTGSSAMMGILRILGVDIGDDLGGKNKWNEKGYLENQEFYRFEVGLLRRANSSWNHIVPEEIIYRGFKEEDFGNLVKKFSRKELWGFKAIRTSLFPEILKKIPNLHLIVTLRSPEAVVASLKRRNNFSRDESLWLYSTYYFRLLRFLSRNKIRNMVVNFDDLVENTEETMKEIAKFLDIPITGKEVNEGKKFVEDRLRHHKEGE